MSYACLDYEVFYHVYLVDKKQCGISIGVLGTEGYLRHPEAEIYLLSVVGDEGEEFVGDPREFDYASIADREWWSHHAAFDKRVYWHLYHQNLKLAREKNWPHPDSINWNCTANISASNHGGRSLKKAVTNLLGGKVSKDVRKAMNGVKAKDMPSMPATDPKFANFWEEVCDYALFDSKWCKAIVEKYGPPKWSEWHRRLSLTTIRGCHGGIPVDVEGLERGKNLLETKIWEVEQKLPWVAEGLPATSSKGLAAHCRLAGIPHPPSTADDDPRAIVWCQTYGEQYPWVGSMQEMRRAKGLLGRVKVLLDRQIDGFFPYEIKFFGAHTGRWSGGRDKTSMSDTGNSFNCQSIPKEPAFGFDLRKCIMAPPGKKFIIADFSQIEARICPYLADDETTIQMIREGMSVYEVHARLTMGYNEPVALKKFDPDWYALAKARRLALQFGCGADRFRDQAQLEYGVGLDWPKTKWQEQVNDFRAKERQVVRLWNRLDMDFKESLGGTYEIELPSGRCIPYFDVSTGLRTSKIVVEEDGAEKPTKSRQSFRARVEMGGGYKWIWGGLLCNNLVQGCATDVFGDGLLRVEDHRPDLTYVWPTHDEAVWLADESDDTAARDVEQLLSVTPDWLPGCPIAAEVHEGKHYEK